MNSEERPQGAAPVGPAGFGAGEAMAGWMQHIVPYGIFTTDADLRVLTWNEWLVAQSGIEAEDVVGRKLLDLFPDLESRRLHDRYVRALHGEISVLSTALHKFLLPFPVTVAGSGLAHMLQTARVAPLAEDGKITGTITIIEDVTQREYHASILGRQQEMDRLLSNALAALLQSEDPVREMEGIFATLRVALGLDVYASYLLGGDQRSLVLNASVGLSPKQREAVAVMKLSQADVDFLLSAGARTQISSNPALEPLRKLSVEAQCSFPLTVGNRIIGLVAFGAYERSEIVSADVNVLARVARYVAIAVDRSIREGETLAASRAKDDFLAALSHELRTPLNPVLLIASDGATNPAFPPEACEAFRIIERNAHLEARLIDDLLDLTRIAHGKLSLEMQTLDVVASLRDALATVRPDMVERKFVVVEELGTAAHFVVGDHARLQQIFWNVLKNAVKFTPRGGQITVRASLDARSNEVVITVADSGVGMETMELVRIFDAFAQGDHATHGRSHRFGGLGLGLAISRKLVELHGGRIEAASAGKDQGSSFTIYLPLASAAHSPTAINAHVPAPRSAPPKEVARRILLVEDHEATRASLQRLLERRGYLVTAVASSEAALQAAAAASFSLVLSDIGLPDDDGFSLMKKLRDNYRLTGIALTGYGMEEDVSRGRAAGFVTHLTKPISMQVLERALEEIFRSKA